MLKHELLGARAERRFLKLASERVAWTPKWLRSIEDAGVLWDIRGIDAFAYCSCIEGNEIRIPIQVKISRYGRERFLKHATPDVVEHVFLFVVDSRKTDDQLRSTLYSRLGQLRRSGKDYAGFLARLEKDAISRRRLKMLVKRVEEQRLRRYMTD